MGYHRAGFEVVGVDINPQPNYPFTFCRGDALLFLREEIRARAAGEEWSKFDAVHASPPCQRYAASTAWRGRREDHPDLIGPTRDLLLELGLPYVLENVPDARSHLRSPLTLCGTQFGMPFRRHRLFETNWPVCLMVPDCSHRETDFAFDHGGKQPESVYRTAIQCDWMTVRESRQAIPPIYTEQIGQQLHADLLLGLVAS